MRRNVVRAVLSAAVAEGAGFWVTVEDGIVTSIEQQFVP